MYRDLRIYTVNMTNEGETPPFGTQYSGGF